MFFPLLFAVQNALPLNQRGVGTVMLAFFRSLGGLLGVTGSGAILARQLHAHGVSAAVAMSPGAHAAPGSAAARMAATLPSTLSIYRHAIGNIFATGAVMVGVAALLLLLLPELPLVDHLAQPRKAAEQ